MYTISEIASAMNAELIGEGQVQAEFVLLFDSRTLTSPDKSIFFAIKSEFNDGHRFIPDLIKKGLKYFVVEKSFEIKNAEGLSFLKVDNTLDAMQKLAAFHRKQFSIPVVGITGSNGKTIVKEWLLQLLGQKLRICANPKSYNSQLGVPLSVWNLKPEHELGLFEAGISAVDQMKNLKNIIQPEMGVLTHLGTAHNEGFDNPDQKLNEKLILFEGCKLVFTQYNENVLKKMTSESVTFGFNEKRANLNITECKREKNETLIKGNYLKEDIEFRIPFTDDASIENACLCCLISLYLKVFEAQSFSRLTPVSMRMELKKGIHRCILVNDSYSNDINALGTALSFLQQQAIHSRTTVILSDIEGSGLDPEVLYLQVKNLLLDKKIKRIIGIGKDYMTFKALFENQFENNFYPDTASFLEDFYNLKFYEESILVKGARRFEFEKIIKKLEQESHGTILEINLSAALKNLNVMKSKLGSNIKIMAMVKAFAYGSGSYEIAKLLQKKVDYLAVAYADEGVALRTSGIDTPIMVMNTGEETYDLLSQYNLEPVVFSMSQLNTLKYSHPTPIKIHLEIDTGMHRLGFNPGDIDELNQVLKNTPSLEVASVFSHLSASDEEQYDDFSLLQFEDLKNAAEKIEKAIGKPVIKHISNTAAALRFSQKGLDMVRLGIGLYGIDPSGKTGKLLEPVFTLKTHITQIKTIPANHSVGYARKAIAPYERQIAILAMGYADGLNRALSNGQGSFWINGRSAPIVGNVCMDMCMVDVSGIDCEEGDEVILFGKDHPIDRLAELLNTIPYEILTSISQRVKRVYVSE